MPRFAANLSMLFTEVPFLDRFERAAKAGFEGVEFLFPYPFPAAEIKARLDANGLALALFNTSAGDWDKGERGLACLPSRVEDFRRAVAQSIEYATALGVRVADPSRKIVALSGDYDFQFLIEELAVGAQFKLPYLHMVVNNAYLGLIRQAQRGFSMDYAVQLGFENVNSPEMGGYGVDHQKVVEGLGCKFVRVRKQEEIAPAIRQAERWMDEFQVPVVVEVML